MNQLIIICDILSPLCQFVSVYLGYRIYVRDRLTKGWLIFAGAFFIQGIRRILTLVEDIRAIPHISTSITKTMIWDRAFMLAISLMILVGLWSMLKNAGGFDFIEKKARDKLKK